MKVFFVFSKFDECTKVMSMHEVLLYEVENCNYNKTSFRYHFRIDCVLHGLEVAEASSEAIASSTICKLQIVEDEIAFHFASRFASCKLVEDAIASEMGPQSKCTKA